MNRSLSDEQIRLALAPFAVGVTTEQISMIREYVALLLKWNRTLSLTTIVDPVEIIARHFGESMFGANVLPVENGRLADVGSGAGFPGLALKILAPALDVTLVESNRKKCVFLAEIVRGLGLKDVDILPLRFEDIFSDSIQSAKFDFITARALGDHHEFLKNAKNKLTSRGHVMMWLGGNDVTKLTSNEDWTWQPAVKIPDSQRRFVLTGRSRLIERQV
jgi:16S rRNA (guanine527-N7)-methyltransferase